MGHLSLLFGRHRNFCSYPQELLERLRTVLDRLSEVGLNVKPSKCELFKTEIKFLGHLVNAHGVSPLPEKLEIIQEWPIPHCLKEVRAFFGLASYYRKFIRNFATIAEPLTRLTRKKQTRFEWTEETQKAFEALKKALVEATSLAFPYPHVPATLDTDASDVAYGAVLSQTIEGVERPHCFFLQGDEPCPTRLLCKGPGVQLPLSPKFAVKKSHTRFLRESPICLCWVPIARTGD